MTRPRMDNGFIFCPPKTLLLSKRLKRTRLCRKATPLTTIFMLLVPEPPNDRPAEPTGGNNELRHRRACRQRARTFLCWSRHLSDNLRTTFLSNVNRIIWSIHPWVDVLVWHGTPARELALIWSLCLENLNEINNVFGFSFWLREQSNGRKRQLP